MPLKADITKWDMSGVSNTANMFANTTFNEDISSWDVSNIRNMDGMFQNNTQFNKDLTAWSVSEFIGPPINFSRAAFQWTETIQPKFGAVDGIFTYPMPGMLTDPTSEVWNSNPLRAPAGYTFTANVGITSTRPIVSMEDMFAGEPLAAGNAPIDVTNWKTGYVTTLDSAFKNTNVLQTVPFVESPNNRIIEQSLSNEDSFYTTKMAELSDIEADPSSKTIIYRVITDPIVYPLYPTSTAIYDRSGNYIVVAPWAIDIAGFSNEAQFKSFWVGNSSKINFGGIHNNENNVRSSTALTTPTERWSYIKDNEDEVSGPTIYLGGGGGGTVLADLKTIETGTAPNRKFVVSARYIQKYLYDLTAIDASDLDYYGELKWSVIFYESDKALYDVILENYDDTVGDSNPSLDPPIARNAGSMFAITSAEPPPSDLTSLNTDHQIRFIFNDPSGSADGSGQLSKGAWSLTMPDYEIVGDPAAPLGVGNWDISRVTSLSSTFEDNPEFNQDISSWDVSNITDMSSAFYDAYRMRRDLSNWDTSKVSGFDDIFRLSSYSTARSALAARTWSAQDWNLTSFLDRSQLEDDYESPGIESFYRVFSLHTQTPHTELQYGMMAGDEIGKGEGYHRQLVHDIVDYRWSTYPYYVNMMGGYGYSNRNPTREEDETIGALGKPITIDDIRRDWPEATVFKSGPTEYLRMDDEYFGEAGNSRLALEPGIVIIRNYNGPLYNAYPSWTGDDDKLDEGDYAKLIKGTSWAIGWDNIENCLTEKLWYDWFQWDHTEPWGSWGEMTAENTNRHRYLLCRTDEHVYKFTIYYWQGGEYGGWTVAYEDVTDQVDWTPVPDLLTRTPMIIEVGESPSGSSGTSINLTILGGKPDVNGHYIAIDWGDGSPIDYSTNITWLEEAKTYDEDDADNVDNYFGKPWKLPDDSNNTISGEPLSHFSHDYADKSTRQVKIYGASIHIKNNQNNHTTYLRPNKILQWGDANFPNFNFGRIARQNWEGDWDAFFDSAVDTPALFGSLRLGYSGAVGTTSVFNTWDTSNIGDMVECFAYGDFNCDISNWDVGSVSAFDSMFYSNATFNQDISNWNVGARREVYKNYGAGIYMEYMFLNADAFNQNLDNWNMTDVRTVYQAFAGASFNNGGTYRIDWDLRRCAHFTGMLQGTPEDPALGVGPLGLIDASRMNTSLAAIPVYDVVKTLQDAGKLVYGNVWSDLVDFDSEINDRLFDLFRVQYGTKANYFKADEDGNANDYSIAHPMWGYPNRYYYPLSDSHTTDPTTQAWRDAHAPEGYQFVTDGYNGATQVAYDGYNDPELNVPDYTIVPGTGIFTSEPITNMSGMFRDNTTFNDPRITEWDVSFVTNMDNMFNGATTFNQDISGWTGTVIIPSLPTDFATGSALESENIPTWGVGLVLYPLTNTTEDPISASYSLGYTFRPSIGVYFSGQPTSFASLFKDSTTFNDPDVITWDMSSVTDVSSMFENASAFNQDISSWVVTSINKFAKMLKGAAAFNQDLSGWTNRLVKSGASYFEFDLGATSYLLSRPDFATFNENLKTDIGALAYYYPCNSPTDLTSSYFNSNVADSGANGDWAAYIPNHGWSSDIPPTSFERMFDNSAFAGDEHTSYWDVSSVTNMFRMFADADEFNQNISSWDVSSVTNMHQMFYRAVFNQDISSWDVSSVTTMERMFYNNDLFNNGGVALTWTTGTANVTDMSYMFYHANAFNQDISSWNVSSVTNMYSMFHDAYAFNQDISSWDVSSVQNMGTMFQNAEAFNNGGVALTWTTGTGTANVTDMNNMFYTANVFNQDISSWDVSSVTTMYRMFSANNGFNNGGVALDWTDTSSLLTTGGMFTGATVFNQNIGSWNVNSVLNMSDMFWDATAFNQDISSWGVSSVTDMSDMFSGATSFDQDISGWDVSLIASKPTNFDDNTTTNWTTIEKPLWGTAGGILYPLSNTAADPTSTTWRTANPTYQFIANVGILMPAGSPITDMGWMFQTATTFNDPDISFWYVSNVTNMAGMFYRANAFNQDISSWNVSNVTDMSYMFWFALVFNDPAVSSWDVSAVTTMRGMFRSALLFNQDISSWDVSNVTRMDSMFYNADVFNQPLNSWNVSSVTNMAGMFNRAYAFNQDISSWNVTKVIKFLAMFYSATAFNNGGVALTWTTTGPLTETAAMTALYGTSYTNYPNTDSYDDPQIFAYMFEGCTSFNQDISTITPYGFVEEMLGRTPAFNNGGVPLTWDMQYVTFADQMFSQIGVSAGIFNAAGVGNWNMSNVQNLGSFFTNQGAFNQDISGWNVANVQFMYNLFEDCTSFNQDISGWNVSSVTNMIQMFDGATAFNQDLSGWDVLAASVAAFNSTPPTDFDTNATAWVLSRPLWGTVPDYSTRAYTYALTSLTDPTSANWTTKPAGYTYYPGEGIGANAPITDMSQMFNGASTFNEDISFWDVSSVINMGTMFQNADAFNQPIGSWNVSSVTDMSRMFYSADAFNQDISSWNVSSVTNMNDMFFYATAFNNGGVALTWTAGTGTANVTNMNAMFYNADAFNQDISSWDVSSVDTMQNMFNANSGFNQDISSWNVSSVTDMSYMFYQATSFDQDISSWNVSLIASEPTNFDTSTLTSWTTLEKPGWGTSGGILYPLSNTATDPTSTNNTWRNANPTYQWIANVGILMPAGSPITSMEQLFTFNTTFNDPDISSWDVSTVTNMQRMFDGASAFDQDISSWNVLAASIAPGNSTPPTNFDLNTPVTWITAEKPGWGTDGTILYPLTGATDPTNSTWRSAYAPASYVYDTTPGAEGIRVKWNEPITNMQSMFFFKSFNQDISSWDFSTVTNMYGMFYGATAFNQDISSWDVSSVTDMQSMFYNADAFNNGGVPLTWTTGTGTSNVIDMNTMFYGADAFNQDISSWDVSSVTNMDTMFSSAVSFNQDISSWDVSSVTDMRYMFYNAYVFNQDLSGWNVLAASVAPGNSTPPYRFDLNATAWILPDSRPAWGTDGT